MSKVESEHVAHLLDWLEGRLSDEEAQVVAREVEAGGEALQAEVAWLQRFHQARQSVRLASPPPSVRENLKERFRVMIAERRPPSLLQRFLATLTFDSHAGVASAGTRSASVQGLERQLIFTTSAAEVALNLQPRPHDHLLHIAGQLFMDAIADGPFSVQLLDATTEVALTATDDLGEFTFTAIPAGDYELIISSDLFEVSIPTHLSV